MERFIYHWGEVRVYHEEEMQCATCLYRQGKASECECYSIKSKSVMNGEHTCPDYRADPNVQKPAES